MKLCAGALVALLAGFAWSQGAHAQTAVTQTQPGDEPAALWPKPTIDRFDSGKLLATGGVSQVEGAGGGGLVPWAVIAGYGTRDAIGANAHYTFVGTRDYHLHSAGLAIGLFDRVELSYDHLWFDTMATGGRLGLGRGFTFEQDVIGAKVKLFGDLVYDQDRWLPQVAIGAQYKVNHESDVLRLIGAKNDHGVDFYAAATKLLLNESLLVNGTLRLTKANQFGILGFGGDREDDYTLQFEGSAAYLLTRQLALGAEYRAKPNNLGFAKENDAYDVFLAWFLNKNASLTLAYTDLGSIATRDRQNGVYASLQIGF